MSARRATPAFRLVLMESEDFVNKSAGQIARIAKERFQAAPADPVEEVSRQVSGWLTLHGGYGGSVPMLVDAVLVALGYPGGSPRQENPNA